MNLYNDSADVFLLDNDNLNAAATRTTHLAIVAHQDDTEIAAYHGIAECFGQNDKWFSSVIVTNGAGSARNGIYGQYSNEQMRDIRRIEQRKAAVIGEYALQIQLDYPSSEVKNSGNTHPVDDIFTILEATTPNVVYLHNPADKHDTHIATLLRALAALRRLPGDKRPKRVLGCEVWRDLDWLQDNEKQTLDCSKHPNISSSLVGVFDSQICGGKRYDLATTGRRLANATYFASHGTDQISAITYAIDLTPLIENPDLSIRDYTTSAIERFKQDVAAKLDRFS